MPEVFSHSRNWSWLLWPRKSSTLGFWRVTPIRSLSEVPIWSYRLIDLFCPHLGNVALDGGIYSLRKIATHSLLGSEGKITSIFCDLEVCRHIYHKKCYINARIWTSFQCLDLELWLNLFILPNKHSGPGLQLTVISVVLHKCLRTNLTLNGYRRM